MKLLIKPLIFILALNFSLPVYAAPSAGRLKPTSQMTTAEVLEREQKLRADVDYNLQQLQNVMRAADVINGELQRNASFPITADFVKDAEAVITQTMSLLSQIYANEQITQTEEGKKEKRAMLKELIDALGALMLQVAHNEGDDFDFETFQAKFQNKNKLMSLTLREFGRDFIGFFTYKKSANGPRVWQPVDQIRREELSEYLVENLQMFARDTMPVLPPERGTRRYVMEVFGEEHPDDRAKGMYSYTSNMINREGIRYTAQKVTAATYLGLAAFGALFPLVDWVGVVEMMTSGSRVDGSATASAVSYFSLWLTVGLIKMKSIDANLLNQLRYLKALTINPQAQPESVEVSKSGFATVSDAVKLKVRSCADYLSGKFK